VRRGQSPFRSHLLGAFGPHCPRRCLRRTGSIGKASSLALRTGNVNKPTTELARRVQALQEAAVSEVFLFSPLKMKTNPSQGISTFQESILDLPAFSEEELLTIYEDLLALPQPSVAKPVSEPALPDSTTELLEIHARNGDVQKVEEYLNKNLTGEWSTLTQVLITYQFHRATNGSSTGPSYQGSHQSHSRKKNSNLSPRRLAHI
jgi:hypothetical protein